MELRPPPSPTTTSGGTGTPRWLAVLNVLLLAAVVALVVLLRRPADEATAGAAERAREVASKLKAAGALDQAAELYSRYLELTDAPGEARARIAYSLGTTYLDRGRYEEALRWFYEAETLGAGSLQGEVSQKIVHSLERLGRYHAAKAALDAGTQLPAGAEDTSTQHADNDPVVARIGQQEIRRSEVEAALDGLPPELAQSVQSPEQRQQFLRHYVADELIWRKAQKLEYDRDPEVRQQMERLLKQLTVGRFVEREVVGKVAVDEADLKTYFEAHKDSYKPSSGEEPKFEQVRSRVEQDYRLFKMQSAYQQMVDSELSTDDVELFPEKL